MTKKPRITITLEPHAYEVLRRLSAVGGGGSMSAIVTGFLDMALPQLERMVVVMEQAKGMPQKTKEAVRDALAQAEAKLLPVVSAALDQNDLFLEQALQEAAALKASRSQGPRRALARSSTPVPVTRGLGQAKRAQRGRP